MADKLDTFERLVMTLESSERQDLLRQLADTTELHADSQKVNGDTDVLMGGREVSPDSKFIEQPLVVRLWFALISIFTAVTPVQAYASHLVSILGKKLARAYSLRIDARRRLYTAELYNDMVRFNEMQEFFSSLLGMYELNKGGFFIILSSLLMKKTSEGIAAVADPFVEPYDKAQTGDVRLSCLRQMDSVFMAIPEDERARMYQAAQGIEWMRRFCTVPLGRILLRFNVMSDLVKGCPIDSINEEMKSLVASLAEAKRVPVLMLEALFLFSAQDRMQEKDFNIEKECASFLSRASEYLINLRNFKATVPLADFVRFAGGDVSWQPVSVLGGEDWFILFKNAWKKRFDERWAEWSRLHRLAMLKKKIMDFLEISEMPSLQYRPWEGLWLSMSMRRELSFLFLKSFFARLYPMAIMKPLKILLIEGDFYRRENLAEFTDAFSILEHQQSLIDAFENRLSPKGDIGEGFALTLQEKMVTIKGKARLQGLMLTTDSDVEVLISRVMAAFQSLNLILGGVLEVVRGGSYETLSNMALIQGKQNELYRKELAGVKQLIREAIGILDEIEIIEKETM